LYQKWIVGYGLADNLEAYHPPVYALDFVYEPQVCFPQPPMHTKPLTPCRFDGKCTKRGDPEHDSKFSHSEPNATTSTCKNGDSCPFLKQGRCNFPHSPEQVEAAKAAFISELQADSRLCFSGNTTDCRRYMVDYPAGADICTLVHADSNLHKNKALPFGITGAEVFAKCGRSTEPDAYHSAPHTYGSRKAEREGESR
jgi:hypothetical protein